MLTLSGAMVQPASILAAHFGTGGIKREMERKPAKLGGCTSSTSFYRNNSGAKAARFLRHTNHECTPGVSISVT